MANWNLVKKMTLWNYEELIEKISEVLAYKFVQEHYDHNMSEAAEYARKIFGFDVKYAEHLCRLTHVFESLSSLRIANYADLIYRVEDKAKTESFLEKTKLPFEGLIFALNYVFRWVLPHRFYLKELVDSENKTHNNYVEKLRSHKIRFNLDLLERGRVREDRERLSKETGIPESFILDLVNLADMSRLPYSNRKTVKHLSAAGYNSLVRIAQEDSEKFIEDMKVYFEKKGMRLSGFIDLRGIAQWAKTVPVVIIS